MNPGSTKPQGVRAGRWWGRVGLVLGLQIGLIFWLGDREPLRRRPAAAAPTLQLASATSAELLALTDPTLFVLPHTNGFAGEAWLRVPPPETNSFEWPETPWSLVLGCERLGTDFEHLIQTNLFAPWHIPARPRPELALPPRAGPEPVAERSTVRFTGELAGRRLLTVLDMPSWQNADLLTNTVVQLVVGAEGRPVSETLLVRSGLDEADEYALARARIARFAPAAGATPDRLPEVLAGLSWGELVCQWQTLPRPLTNAPGGP